jgi:hypothetical protein
MSARVDIIYAETLEQLDTAVSAFSTLPRGEAGSRAEGRSKTAKGGAGAGRCACSAGRNRRFRLGK